MAQETRPLPYREFAEHIEEHLDALDEPGSELRIEKDGRVYRIQGGDAPRTDIWAAYSPERALAVFERRAGNVLEGVDVEQLLRDLRAARGQDSVGRPGD